MSIILNNLWQSVAAILQQTISISHVDTSKSVTLLSKLAFDAVLEFQIEATCKRKPRFLNGNFTQT